MELGNITIGGSVVIKINQKIRVNLWIGENSLEEAGDFEDF